MTTYTDHTHKDLQKDRNMGTYTPIAFFTSYEFTEKWLIKHGKKLEKEYTEQFDQPCVFCIISMKNLLPSSEKFGDNMEICEGNTDLYMSNKGHPTYAFSKDSHQMTLDENFIFCSHDWGHPVFDDIFYVKGNKIYYACTEKHVERCIADVNYFEEPLNSLKQEIKDFKQKVLENEQTSKKYFLK